MTGGFFSKERLVAREGTSRWWVAPAALAKDEHRKLAAFAVGAATVAWLVGMAIAVIWSNPIY